MPYGFARAEWEAAKREAREVLIDLARDPNGLISYSGLVARINTIELEAHDLRLFELLGEISMEEDAQGHGMLSAVVVYKDDNKKYPGRGFFELAERLGRDTSDETAFWIAELNMVRDYWGNR